MLELNTAAKLFYETNNEWTPILCLYLLSYKSDRNIKDKDCFRHQVFYSSLLMPSLKV